MPFTVAHTAAVLPLLGRRLDATCLVIGAMAPDLEYVARGSMAGGRGHTLLGLLVWCVPITLLTALAWHRVGKWPLLWAAPTRVAARLAPEVGRAWPVHGRLVTVGSALLGAVTHVAWDSVTHSNGWVVRHVPGMEGLVTLPGLGVMALPRVLQHASTVLGLIVLAAWLARRPWPPPAVLPPVERGGARWLLAALLVGGVALLLLYNVLRAGRGMPSIGDLVVGTMTGGVLGGLAFAALVRARVAPWAAAISARRGAAS